MVFQQLTPPPPCRNCRNMWLLTDSSTAAVLTRQHLRLQQQPLPPDIKCDHKDMCVCVCYSTTHTKSMKPADSRQQHERTRGRLRRAARWRHTIEGRKHPQAQVATLMCARVCAYGKCTRWLSEPLNTALRKQAYTNNQSINNHPRQSEPDASARLRLLLVTQRIQILVVQLAVARRVHSSTPRRRQQLAAPRWACEFEVSLHEPVCRAGCEQHKAVDAAVACVLLVFCACRQQKQQRATAHANMATAGEQSVRCLCDDSS